MNIENVMSAGNLIYLVIVGVGGLVINNLKDRIKELEKSTDAKIEEVKTISRRDDDSLERRNEKEMDRRIENVVALHAKVEKAQNNCTASQLNLGERVANVEGYLRGKNEQA